MRKIRDVVGMTDGMGKRQSQTLYNVLGIANGQCGVLQLIIVAYHRFSLKISFCPIGRESILYIYAGKKASRVEKGMP